MSNGISHLVVAVEHSRVAGLAGGTALGTLPLERQTLISRNFMH